MAPEIRMIFASGGHISGSDLDPINALPRDLLEAILNFLLDKSAGSLTIHKGEEGSLKLEERRFTRLN